MKLLVLSLLCGAVLGLSMAKGWKNEGRQYDYFPEPKSWADAQTHCQKRGGNLAGIYNECVNNHLKKLARNDPAWVGFSDAQTDGSWFWINGDGQDFLGWCENEPNNYKGPQECALINWTEKKCWDDETCQTKLPYICEK